MIEQNSTSVDWNSKDKILGGALSNTSEDFSYDIALIRHDFMKHKHLFTHQERKVLKHLLFTKDGIGKSMVNICFELNINKSHASKAYKKPRSVCS